MSKMEHRTQIKLYKKELNENDNTLLFEDKSEWSIKNKDNIDKFWAAIKRLRSLIRSNNLEYSFKGIHFPEIPDNDMLDDIENFSNCTFYEKVSFKEATFEDEVKFSGATFKKNADFSEVNFKGDTYFDNCTFLESVTFENSECEGSIDFSGMKFKNIKLDKADFPKASYLNLKGLSDDNQKEKLEKDHFKTRESARVIKAHLETQKNISEANKYFVIEQNMHYDDEKNILKPFPLLMDKIISDFGTNWVRVLMVIVFFSFFVFTLHSYDLAFQFDMEGVGNMLNGMVKYINPVSIFKNENPYNGNEFWGMVVKVIIIYLFWQFAKSFRVQTKRN